MREVANGEAITAIAPALAATHAQHVELADEVTEDDCAVAGHGLKAHAENKPAIARQRLRR